MNAPLDPPLTAGIGDESDTQPTAIDVAVMAAEAGQSERQDAEQRRGEIGSEINSGFSAELLRLDRLIEREIARLRARYELSLDEFRGLYVSDEQVDALLHRVAPQVDLHAPPEAPEPRIGSRWAHLAQALQLNSDDLDLVLLALAPELHSKYEVLFAYLNNDVTRKLPSAELATRLFARNPEHRLQLRQRLSPDAPLLSRGVLEFSAATREWPRMQRGFRLPSALADWLLGLQYEDERLSGLVRLIDAQSTRLTVGAERASATDSGADVLARLVQRSDDAAPVLVVTAPAAADAARAAQHALVDSQRGALVLDLLAFRAAPAPNDCVNALTLMQAMLGVGMVAAPADALVDADGRPLDVPCTALRRLAKRTRPLVIAAGVGVRWRDVLGETRAVEMPLRELDAHRRFEIWRSALAASEGKTVPPVDVDDAALLAVADRFNLGIERIDNAARYAADLARADGAPAIEPRHLYAAARAVSVEGGSDVVRPVRQQFEWNDLIVPPDVRQRLRDLVHAVELRPHVFDRWNFAHPSGGQRGIKAMFAGPSGTGKTMAAAIVARELGLDLHRIELSAVMSKYIGETEKNLERAFGAARRANAILFIDEADALLGKRSEVKDAHDRYANVEVAFLLQKMEDHDGVVIIATNLAHNIDAAFARRMQLVIQFPLPDIASRERLWQAMLPPEAPRAADLDVGFLARQFQFAGGDIRNIVLEAAFRAAHQRTAIGMREMLGAVITHYTKSGKLPHANEFGQYAGLLRAVDARGGGTAVLPGARAQRSRTDQRAV